ncbi:MFS transporter [Streptomyces sp. NPDC006984]|uniref:MFS transporter n=1 Tax=Streptomyces sp. NPDC006984 TaxID=3155463 RepID=UPI0033CC9013
MCTFLARAAGFAFPFLSFRLAELGFSTRMAGLVLAAFGAGWLVGSIVCGAAADRIGRRTTLVATMGTAATVLPLLAAASTPAAALAAAAVVGALYDAHRPIVSAVIQDQVASEQDRARIGGARHFAVNAAAATTGAVGGWLAPATGIDVLLLINAAACLLVALIAAAALPADSRTAAPSPGRGPAPRRTALRDVRLWLVCLASLAALTACVGMFSSLPMLMARDGLSAASYGWTQAATAVVVVAATPLLMSVLTRRAARPTAMVGPLALSSLILGTGMGAAGFADTTAQYSAAAMVTVVGEIILFTAASDIVNRISPPDGRGLYAGVWGAQLAIAIIAAPLLSAWTLDAGGELFTAAAVLATGVLGALLCLPLHALLPHHSVRTPACLPPSCSSAPEPAAATASR